MLRSIVAAAAMMVATGASAEFLQFDDSGKDRITVTANGFEIRQLRVNGQVFDSQGFQNVSFDFAKGATLDFQATYIARDLSDVDTTYQLVTAADPDTVIGELLLNRSIARDDDVGGDVQRIDGVYRGIGSSRAFGALGSGTTILLEKTNAPFNASPAFAGRDLTGNLDLNFAAPVAIPVTGAVPEPASWALMIGGFGMVGGAMRRRNTSAKIAVA